MDFLWNRLSKRKLYLSLALGTVLAGFQMSHLLKPIPAENSPYTRWLSIDPFDFTPIIFFILLPLIAAIPASTLLKEDADNGFIAKVKIRVPLQQVLTKYATIAFITGMIVVVVPLLLNFLAHFLFLPNAKPDNLLNSNILLISKNTLFVSLYYTNPFLHALLSITFAAFWGGMFSAFVMTTSLWIRNKFVALSAGLVLQIATLLISNFLALPDGVSLSPADFLHEMAPTNINVYLVALMTLLMLVYCLTLLTVGGKRIAP